MTAYNGGFPPDQSDSANLVWPGNRKPDLIRDELEARWAKAYAHWEFVWDLSEKDKSLRSNAVWISLQHKLAVLADEAFDELEDHRGGTA